MSALIEGLPAWLREIPLGKQLLESREKAAHAARQADIDELARIAGEERALDERHAKAITPLFVAAADAREQARRSEDKLLAGQRRRANELAAVKARRDLLERNLRASADPRIEVAKRAIEDRWERQRHSAFRVQEFQTSQIDSQGRRVVKQANNESRIKVLRTAMRVARDRFEALKLENPADLDAVIAAIEASIPWDITLTVDPPPAA